MSAIQFVKSLQLLGGKNKEITSWKGDANPENEKEQTIPDDQVIVGIYGKADMAGIAGSLNSIENFGFIIAKYE